MRTKRAHEGYLMIDHRAADGLQDAPPGAIAVKSGSMFESATVTCSHCQTVVVLNPDRSRSRGYCPKCDHYVCDSCEAIRIANGGACKTFKQIVDEVKEAGAKAA